MSIALAALLAAAAVPPRVFTIRYQARVVPREGAPLDLYLPLPPSVEGQEVISSRVEGAIPGKESREDEYGNRFWHGHIDAAGGKPLEVQLVASVRRTAVKGPLSAGGATSYAAEERAANARWLRADGRVPIAGEPVDSISREIDEKLGDRAKDPAAVARAIYDYVIENMEYKKVGSGWGNGDTYWACSAKYGNCTDFHALFISLARKHGIPTKFEIGFPVPDDRPAGSVGGYHCWVDFYLPGRGWVPVDASEARKHPEQRELLFGTKPVERVQLSEGRDLRLGQSGPPLNYFVYPYLEVAGKPSKDVTWTFEYQDSPPN